MTNTATTATQQVQILGPNLRSRDEQMHVHRLGCADVQIGRRYSRSNIDSAWAMGANSVQDVVEAIYADMITEDDDGGSDWKDYDGDVRVFPCVKVPYERKAPYCSTCTNDWPDRPHADGCARAAEPSTFGIDNTPGHAIKGVDNGHVSGAARYVATCECGEGWEASYSTAMNIAVSAHLIEVA